MARKRFTDTEKWNDVWFRTLPPKMKCAWSYICDTCDNAGIWKIDYEGLSFNVGERIRPEEFEKCFGKRVKVIAEDRIWILKFIDFQAGVLKAGNRPHEQILGILKENDLIGLYKGITRVNKGYGEGIGTLQEKNRTRKEKEQDTEWPEEKEHA